MKMDMIVRLKRMALITFAFFLSWMSANGECMSMQKQLSNVQFLNITLKNTEVSIALADSPMITYDSDILSFFTIGKMFQIPVADVQGWHFSDTPTAIIQRETPKPNIAQGYVYLAKMKPESKACIYNVKGELMRSETANEQGEAVLEFGSLPKDVYILKTLNCIIKITNK